MTELLIIAMGALCAVAGALMTACHMHHHPDHHPRRRKDD